MKQLNTQPKPLIRHEVPNVSLGVVHLQQGVIRSYRRYHHLHSVKKKGKGNNVDQISYDTHLFDGDATLITKICGFPNRAKSALNRVRGKNQDRKCRKEITLWKCVPNCVLLCSTIRKPLKKTQISRGVPRTTPKSWTVSKVLRNMDGGGGEGLNILSLGLLSLITAMKDVVPAVSLVT